MGPDEIINRLPRAWQTFAFRHRQSWYHLADTNAAGSSAAARGRARGFKVITTDEPSEAARRGPPPGRRAQEAAMILGPIRTREIVGRGGLAGASIPALWNLLREAEALQAATAAQAEAEAEAEAEAAARAADRVPSPLDTQGLEGLSTIMDPTFREFRAVRGGGGIPLKRLQVDYSESGMVPDEMPLRSTQDAARLLEWLHEKRREQPDYKPGGVNSYWKTVISARWDDGAVWRGRFDVDGSLTEIPDLFAPEAAAGGITWANTTDPSKFYAVDQVFADVARFSKREAENYAADRARRQREHSTALGDRAYAALTEALGFAPEMGRVYLQPEHSRPDDDYVHDRYIQFTRTGDGRLLAEVYLPGWERQSPMALYDEDPRAYSSWGPPDGARLVATAYTDIGQIPPPVGVRDVAAKMKGGTGARNENRIIKETLRALLGPGYSIKTRSSRGTGYGWSSIDVTPLDTRAKAALRAIGMSHGHGERYYARIPRAVWPDVAKKVKVPVSDF